MPKVEILTEGEMPTSDPELRQLKHQLAELKRRKERLGRKLKPGDKLTEGLIKLASKKISALERQIRSREYVLGLRK
jgi:hypothetical protein